MTLKELNKAVCSLVTQAAAASGTGAELVAEDLSAPFVRPCVKVELEGSADARAAEACVEDTVTFRVYFFARDPRRPKLDNLAMREALNDLFSNGIPTEEGTVPIDDGLSFSVSDGVLVAAIDLSLDQEIPETAELMETLQQNLEVI